MAHLPCILQIIVLFTSFFFLSVADLIFTVIFTTEMIIKMFALGFTGQFYDRNGKKFEGYFDDGFNCLDCFVVCGGILGAFLPNITSVRILRLLKPLRSISQFSGNL